MKIKSNNRILLKISPYIASLLAAILFYTIGLNLESENLISLFINIASTFLVIPLIYLFYQTAQNYSERKLNKELFDYAKLQVDTEILSLIKILYKIVHPLETDMTLKKQNEFLSIDGKDILTILSKNEYLGFQIFKKLDVNEGNLHEILKNPYMLEKLGNEEIISIISIIKGIRAFGFLQNNPELYRETSKKNSSYRIVNGKELNPSNTEFPDRYILLKDLGNNKHLIADFGDFKQYNVEKLLYIFNVNENLLKIYSETIANLILEFNNWVDLTGSEFIIDSKMFRFKKLI